jgi:hypothetical protein
LLIPAISSLSCSCEKVSTGAGAAAGAAGAEAGAAGAAGGVVGTAAVAGVCSSGFFSGMTGSFSSCSLARTEVRRESSNAGIAVSDTSRRAAADTTKPPG